MRLVRSLLEWDQARWLAEQRDPANPLIVAAFQALVAKRAERVPLDYLIGDREFYGRSFLVEPGALIPRPETEFVVEAALAVLPATGSPTIVDVGTGTGCIALTLAAERPTWSITAVDLSPDALALAQRNARRLGLAGQVTFLEGSLLEPVAGPIDLIVSNPPYVPLRDRPTLAAEVRDHEPALALFGGEDGLEVIRALVPASVSRLGPGGHLIFEFGAGQLAGIEAIVADVPQLRFERVVPDLQDIPRVAVLARR